MLGLNELSLKLGPRQTKLETRAHDTCRMIHFYQ